MHRIRTAALAERRSTRRCSNRSAVFRHALKAFSTSFRKVSLSFASLSCFGIGFSIDVAVITVLFSLPVRLLRMFGKLSCLAGDKVISFVDHHPLIQLCEIAGQRFMPWNLVRQAAERAI